MTFKINDFIVGNSPLILELKKLLTQVSDTDASILILGESGTGKELVARAIHNLSSRSSNNFILNVYFDSNLVYESASIDAIQISH